MTYSRVPAHNPRGPYWQGYAWSEWSRIEDARPPKQRGVYRVRSGRAGLDYIGISDDLAMRVGILRRCHQGRSGAHPACRCIREAPGFVRVSRGTFDEDEVSRRELYGIEVELIAAYRAAIHESPHCQWSERLRREGRAL
jgi:hypothetical protein